MKRLKIGIAGAGGQGKTHLFNSLRLKNIEVLAIADSSKFALSKLSKLKIRTYNNYEEMINKESLDAIIIALPNYLHEECATLAAEKGIDILIEKPIARNAEEARRIAQVARRNGINLMVGMCMRFAEDCWNLKKQIEVGAIGRIDFASALLFTGPFYDGKRVPKWMFDPLKIGGGALLDTGCHLIDLLLWYFGDVQVVNGHTESFYNLGYEDYAEVGIRFKNGVNGLAVVSWRTRIPSFRVEVVGEFGRRLALSKSFGMFDVGLRKAALLFAKENILSSFFKERQFLPLGEEFYKMLRYFANCILNDEKPEPSGDDLVRVSEIIDSVYNR